MDIAFISRHGPGHVFNPSIVPDRPGDYRVGLLLWNGMVLYYGGSTNPDEAVPVHVVQGAETPGVDRVLVNHAIKRELCRRAMLLPLY